MKSRDWVLLTIVLAFGALLRGAYLMEIKDDPAFSHPIYDPEYNAYWARGLAAGDWQLPPGVNDPEIRSTPHGRPPGYPWFLTLTYLLFGVNDWSPRLVQMALGLVNAALMYFLGRRLFGRGIGFIAALFMALYWAFPYFEGLLTYPTVVVCILLCMLHAILRWRERPNAKGAAAVGFLLGLFGLFRPNALLFAPVLVLWMARVRGNAGLSRIRWMLAATSLALGIAAVLTPAFVRNYMVARDVVFISSYGGINFYVGNHPEASLVEPRIPELLRWAGIEHWSCFDYAAIVRGVAAEQGLDNMKFSEANRYFYRKTLGFIRERPGLFLKNLAKKALLFWGPHEITNDTVMAYDKQFSKTLHWLPGFPTAAALFVFGSLMLLLKRRRASADLSPLVRDMSELLWLFALTYFLSVIIYFVAGRYRMPVIPVMLLFGACGVMEILQLFKQRRSPGIAAALAALVVLWALFHCNPLGYKPSEGTWHLRKALAWSAAGDEAKAYDAYQAALAHGAESSLVFANLGRLHIEQGEIETGLELYRRGLECNPGNAVIRNNLGYQLYKAGNTEEAISHLTQATIANPRFALAHTNLGHALADLGQIDEALKHFQTVAEISPSDPNAWYNVARMLFLQGDNESAVENYERALRLRPDFAEALNNIGYIYASQGRLDDAVEYYNRAIAADEKFTLAYNNLGNALLAANEMDAAEAAYANAARQNPEDVFAWFNLGRVEALRGNRAAARVHLERAAALKPDFKPALDLLGRLLPESQEYNEPLAP